MASTQLAQSAAVEAERLVERVPKQEDLWTAWDGAAGRTGSPIEQSIWSRACMDSICAGYDTRLVTARSAGAVVAVAPLARRSHTGAFEQMGVEALYEPMDLIYRDTDALYALAQELVQLNEPIFLRRVPATSSALEAIREATGAREVALGRDVTGTPAIDLDECWKEPESRFNAGRRSDLRRAQRHAEKLGPVSYEIIRPHVGEVEALLEEALRIEAASWKGEEGSALALDAMRGRFFRLWTLAAAEAGILRLCFMRIGENRVAMQLATECGGRFWLLKIGYDQQYAKCSPGSLLMLHTLRYAAGAGLRSYEFLGSPAPWTAVWATTLRPCVSIRLYPLRASGLAAITSDVARSLGPRLGRLFGKGE